MVAEIIRQRQIRSGKEAITTHCDLPHKGERDIRTICVVIMIGILFCSCSASSQSIANSNKCFSKPDTLDGNEVFRVVSRQPEYAGGLQQFYKDVVKGLNHPKDRGKLSEKITFTFIVDKDGRVRKFCFIDPGYGTHDKEMDSLVLVIDHWSPGELHNRKVNTRMIHPMTIEWQ